MGQIKDIEARIESLVQVLTSPVGDKDTEEKARREVLRKFVFYPSSDTDVSKRY